MPFLSSKLSSMKSTLVQNSLFTVQTFQNYFNSIPAFNFHFLNNSRCTIRVKIHSKNFRDYFASKKKNVLHPFWQIRKKIVQRCTKWFCILLNNLISFKNFNKSTLFLSFKSSLIESTIVQNILFAVQTFQN